MKIIGMKWVKNCQCDAKSMLGGFSSETREETKPNGEVILHWTYYPGPCCEKCGKPYLCSRTEYS